MNLENATNKNNVPILEVINSKDVTQKSKDTLTVLKGNDEKLLNDQKKEKQKELLKKVSENPKLKDKKLEFSIHKETNKIMIKVIDKQTEKVIREIPPEEILDMIGKAEEYLGLFIDDKK